MFVISADKSLTGDIFKSITGGGHGISCSEYEWRKPNLWYIIFGLADKRFS